MESEDTEGYEARSFCCENQEQRSHPLISEDLERYSLPANPINLYSSRNKNGEVHSILV
jgi:hypothetical protein